MGFDVKIIKHVLKLRKKDKDALAEEDSLIDLYVCVNFPALYDSAKSLASMLYGRIARNSSSFLAL